MEAHQVTKESQVPINKPFEAKKPSQVRKAS